MVPWLPPPYFCCTSATIDETLALIYMISKSLIEIEIALRKLTFARVATGLGPIHTWSRKYHSLCLVCQLAILAWLVIY